MRFIFLISFIVFFNCAKAQFFTNDTELNIIDNNDDYQYSYLNVNNVGVITCDIKLCVDVTHSYVSDLRIRLRAPNGNRILVVRNEGNNGENFTNTCFTMDAVQEIEDITNDCEPFEGYYVPQGNNNGLNFDSFVGISADGEWTLEIGDWWFDDIGTLNSWSLDFTCPELCNNYEVDLSFSTDNYASESSWIIVNSSSEVLQSACYGNEDNEVFNYQFCLESGCYDFIINDSYGDGLEGIDVDPLDDGNYEITDSDGNILVQMANADFGAQSIHEFCLGSSGCTDPSACNYEPDADADDGSCYYSPLDVNACEILFCDTQEGEQSTDGDPIEYLNIPITESGTLNELHYNISWHSQNYCDNLGEEYSGVRIRLYDQNNELLNDLVNESDGCPVDEYISFSSTDLYDLTVETGYYIQVEAWRLYPGWESYINLAQVSFTIDVSPSPQAIVNANTNN